ncbi:MAG: helix-turn-helix transcriptional regulator [Eggerthellaceae bacterium]|nr:helix-turn-helix transcriptional regulator [Eggerthellaceae bacterium]
MGFCTAGMALSLAGIGVYALGALGGPDAALWACWTMLGIPCGVGFYIWSAALGGRKRGTTVVLMAAACLAAGLIVFLLEVMGELASLAIACLLPIASFICYRVWTREAVASGIVRPVDGGHHHRGRVVLDGVVHVVTQCFGFGLGFAGILTGLSSICWCGAVFCCAAVVAACVLLLVDWRGPALLNEERANRYQFAIVIGSGFVVAFFAGTPVAVAAGVFLVASTWACALLGCSSEAESAFSAEMNLSMALSRDWGFSLAGAAVGLATGAIGFAFGQEYSTAFPAIMAFFAVVFASVRARSMAPQSEPISEDEIASSTECAPPSDSTTNGDDAVPSDTFEARCQAIADAGGLSARQREVMLLLARGRDSRYIQDKLVISRGTADTHIYNIYRKLDIHSKQELIDLVEHRL